MKQQKHKRKETFSLIFASNIGNDTKQFYLSVVTLRLIIVLMALICITFAWTIFRSGTHYQNETELRKKLASSEQTVKQLTKERDTLSAQNVALEEENELFRQAESLRAELAQEVESQPESSEEETARDTSVPSQLPCTAGGILKEQYTEEHPFISFSAQPEDRIIAAGDGMIASVGADDTYPVIIEVDHGNGYRSRYMCQQEAAVSVETGQQVQVRDTLVTVNGGETQLDYQVIFEEQAIDPLQILEAKG